MNKNKTAVEVFKALAENRWNDTFLHDARNERSYTYGEFFSAALNAKDTIATLGIHKGDTVCMVVENSADTLMLYMGALMAGVRIALIDPLKGVDDIRSILDQITFAAVIASIPSPAFGRSAIAIIVFRDTFFETKRNKAEVIAALNGIDTEAIFLITFTSGSTGAPKGVMHSLGNLYRSAEAFSDQFGFGPKHTFYHHLPMTYMAGVLNSFFQPLFAGSALVVGPRFSVAEVSRFWDIPIRYKVNVFWLIPTMLSLLLKLDRGEAGKEYAQSTKIIGLVGTAPLPRELHRAFEEQYKIPLYESYGLSETLLTSTQAPSAEGDIGSVGKVLPGTTVTVAEDSELGIRSSWMYKGYLIDRKEVPFDQSSFVSGDLGEINPEGYLQITGRKKDIIIRGGINLSPRHLEEFMAERKVFEECVVCGFPDPVVGEKIVCFYSPHPRGFSEKERGELIEELRAKLGREYAIDEFVEMKEIPRNINGKIDKLKLRASYTEPSKSSS